MDIRIGIIGGTGLGDVLLAQMDPSHTQSHQPPETTTPFGEPSSPIITGTYEQVDIAILQRHGDGHTLNPSAVPYRANIFALKQLGCTHILASGAVGSLREQITPGRGDLVICDQFIDRTMNRPCTFYEQAAVHVEFADPVCPVMRQWLLNAAVEGAGSTIHERGTYICIEGPSFSTRAESEVHRQWGADVVGMTALPEARLAREAEMAYALIALPTDYDCWRTSGGGTDISGTGVSPVSKSRTAETAVPPSSASLIAEIIANLERATNASIALIKAALADVSILQGSPSPAHSALDLAIWSDKSKIDPSEIERLRVLWGRCFK